MRPHLAHPRLGVESAREVGGVTWEVTRPEIKILRADSGFYWELVEQR